MYRLVPVKATPAGAISCAEVAGPPSPPMPFTPFPATVVMSPVAAPAGAARASVSTATAAPTRARRERPPVNTRVGAGKTRACLDRKVTLGTPSRGDSRDDELIV